MKWNLTCQESVIKTEISQDSKILAADNYRKKLLELQQNYSENIIIYSDGSKLSYSQAGTRSYISYFIDNQHAYSWHLHSNLEAFDIEIFAILKSIQQAEQNINASIKNIWIFSDNQAVIQRINNNSNSSGQEISYKIQCEAEFLLSQNIQLHICWVPGHVGIYGNEQADKAAKIAAAADIANLDDNIIDCSDEIGISLTYLRRMSKNSLLQEWHNHYNSAKKGAYYQNLDIQPVWKPPNLLIRAPRIVWSSYIQLKIGHGHFKSYLKRLPDYSVDFDDKCDCNYTSIQSPAHLLLSCSKYQAAREKMKNFLKISNISLKILFTKREGILAILNFLKETQIARRNWLEN